MWHGRYFIFWTRLIAVILTTTGRLLQADATPAPDSGYKDVPVTVGGKTTSIRVREQSDPYRNVPSPDTTAKYDPERIFSATSSMAGKKFSVSSDSGSPAVSDFKDRDRNTFVTKSYTSDAASPSVPNLDGKAAFATTSAYSRSATGFDKNYATPNADAGQNRAALVASATSTDQGRTAVLGGQTTSTYASPLAGKTFDGSEADAARQHLSRTKSGQILIADIPNRPLTIDEVRDLINHGFKADTEAKPEAPSKPLNDPDYKPEPLRDAPAPAADEDKDDPVPSPGTMAAPAAPENSEPLPQP